MNTLPRINDLLINETDDYIALNKPSGLLSIPDREGKEISLKNLLIEKYERIFTVHRLDRDTSGLILFAKNEVAHRHFSMQFENRDTKKIYYGLVLGSPSPPEGSIDAPIMEHPGKKGLMVINRKGKEALTDYKTVHDFKVYSWMQFRIHTGRTHQIRIHMKNAGHPIVCDVLYGDGKPVLLSSLKSKFKLSRDVLEERPILNRLALHASQLTLTGLNNEPLELEAPLPKDLRATLQQLEKRKKK
ncbi:MAG: RNA pseudouridine synthase [Chitinophagaceae bacterium]